MPKFKATAYIRLSYTDDRSSESDSVSNQRRLIENFVERNPDIEVVSEKIDDGYSGIIFDRPAFKEMMQDITDGNINCRHSEADEKSRCHKMRINAAELEKAVFITLKKQMEAAASLNPDGTVRLEVAVPERSEYEQQIEELQDGKRLLYERYLLGEIDLDTYKAEKTACDELLLKTKNAYAAVLAQAKQKQEERSRQESREEAAKAILDADTLTTELADFLIDRVLVYPDNRIEIAYKIKDIFD